MLSQKLGSRGHPSDFILQGYYGAAIGKAKQSAKTEIEKLKMQDMTCEQIVKEAAKMSVTFRYLTLHTCLRRVAAHKLCLLQNLHSP